MTTYHQRVAQEKRALIVRPRPTVPRVGLRPDVAGAYRRVLGVSKATLFKQFPTKAALFDAIVIDSWAR